MYRPSLPLHITPPTHTPHTHTPKHTTPHMHTHHTHIYLIIHCIQGMSGILSSTVPGRLSGSLCAHDSTRTQPPLTMHGLTNLWPANVSLLPAAALIRSTSSDLRINSHPPALQSIKFQFSSSGLRPPVSQGNGWRQDTLTGHVAAGAVVAVVLLTGRGRRESYGPLVGGRRKRCGCPPLDLIDYCRGRPGRGASLGPAIVLPAGRSLLSLLLPQPSTCHGARAAR